jgi:predicted transcriptional regulator
VRSTQQLDSEKPTLPLSNHEAENTLSITLPPDLLAKAQQLADREQRTISELCGEALRRYLGADSEWDNLLKRTREIGAMTGIQTEEEVERLSDEYRCERRR